MGHRVVFLEKDPLIKARTLPGVGFQPELRKRLASGWGRRRDEEDEQPELRKRPARCRKIQQMRKLTDWPAPLPCVGDTRARAPAHLERVIVVGPRLRGGLGAGCGTGRGRGRKEEGGRDEGSVERTEWLVEAFCWLCRGALVAPGMPIGPETGADWHAKTRERQHDPLDWQVLRRSMVCHHSAV